MKLSELKAKNVLGTIMGVALVFMLVELGRTFLKTNELVIGAFTTVIILVLAMGVTVIYLRCQRRYTKRLMHKTPDSYYYDPITPLEQKILQMTIILFSAIIILGGSLAFKFVMGIIDELD